MLKNFLESRIEKWKRLEELTARASSVRLRGLKGEEVREFGRIYRRTAADLAIAREEVADKRLVNYLNHLVARAHGAIYRTESSGFGSIVEFFRYEYPALFRKHFRYILSAFLIFAASALFAFVVCQFDPEFLDRINPGLRDEIVAHRDWTQSAKHAMPLASSDIMTNNITVTFTAFSGGIVFGVITVWSMIFNGLHLGAVISVCIRYRFWKILIFVSGHGVIELTAIFIAGGAGLMLGKALLMPGDMRRTDALVSNGRWAIRLLVGCIPMLVVAGLIEGFISPSDIPSYYKLTISATSGLLMLAYFLKPDRRKATKSESPDSSATRNAAGDKTIPHTAEVQELP